MPSFRKANQAAAPRDRARLPARRAQRRGSAPSLLLLLAALTMDVPHSPARAKEPVYPEFAWVEPIWIPRPGAQDARPVPGMVEQPPGWAPGDAAAILLPRDTGPDAARDRLIERLLREGAMVVLLYAPRGVPADVSFGDPGPRALPREFLPVLFGALLAVRRDYGAGEVVALGHGGARVDRAALRAASESAASALLGKDTPGFTAAAGLGGLGRAAAFAPGATPPGRAGWPSRVPPLCAVLGRAAAELMLPQPARAAALGAERDCSIALLRPLSSAAAGEAR